MTDDRRTFTTLEAQQRFLQAVCDALPPEGPGITVDALCEALVKSTGNPVDRDRVWLMLRYLRAVGMVRDVSRNNVSRWCRAQTERTSSSVTED